LLYTVSIAVHNRQDLTAQCLNSLLAFSDPQQSEILVWDNASDAETAEILDQWAKRFPNLRVHHSEQNIGFGEAHNRQLEIAAGAYFVALNNDTEIQGEFLSIMRREFLNDSRLGLCGMVGGCCALREDGCGIPGDAQRPEYVEGSCLMIPAWLGRKEVLFSPEFRFAYCEDVDLSLRLRQKGWRIRLLNLPVTHLRGATAQTVGLLHGRNGAPDLPGFHAINHAILRRKWQPYFAKRSFERRVLVIRGAALGDVLMLTPILHAMKERDTGTAIDVLTHCTQVLEHNPAVNAASNDRAALEDRYDETLDLDIAYEKQPRQHIIASYAKAAGLDPGAIDWRLRVYPGADARQKAKELAAEMQQGNGQYVVFHTGITAWPGRNWHRDRFEIIARRLQEQGWGIVVVGNHATPKLDAMEGVRRIISRPFSEVAAVIERAGLFVGLDSFPMHLAQAALVPTVGIFGMIDPQYRLLPFPFIRAARIETLGCIGCHHEQPAPRTDGSCLRDRDYCMENLSEETVWEAIGQVLEAKKMYLEASKIRERIYKYVQEGSGIDIGCGRDKIMPGCVGYDDDPWAEVDQVGDARKINFPDHHFDWVFSSHCLEDLADTEAVLEEWLRILRAGGNLILYVPHPELYKGFNQDHKVPGFRPEELCALLDRLGCEVLEAYVDDGPDRYSTCVVARKL